MQLSCIYIILSLQQKSITKIIYEKENGGARNFGIKEADYVAFLETINKFPEQGIYATSYKLVVVIKNIYN